jgi:hypothetical protein
MHCAFQVPDTYAVTMSVADFRESVSAPGAFRDLVGRYTQVVIARMMQSTACNALHHEPVSARRVHRAAAFSTSVMGAAFCSTKVFIRNRWPSPATTYSCRLPPVRVLEMRVTNRGTGEDGSSVRPSGVTWIATAISFPSGAT